MKQTAVRNGYPATTIAEVIAAAGVSRPTFYEYFSDKEECFLAALAEAHAQLLSFVTHANEEAPPERAVDALVATLVAFAASRPETAQLLMSEAMAGGPRVLDARDDALGEIAALIDQAQKALPRDTVTPDIPLQVLLGTVHRLLARRLRRGERDLGGVTGDLQGWIKSYEEPLGEHRWRKLTPSTPPPPWNIVPETQLREPAPLAGRRRDAKEVAENQRQRILFATATVAQSKGYAATTITDIAQRAGVNRRAFNALFADKHDAFMAVIAFGFQRTIAVTAGAFFTAATWPERIWEAGRAFTDFLHASPALAHIGFVETYAVGPEAAQQLEESVNAFTIFLREGVRQAGKNGGPPSMLALEAIATSVFETAYQESRGGNGRRMSTLLPHVAFLCLAPIIGAVEANTFIDGRLGGNEQIHLER
jgi:AcrR family transcriptional regulator